MFWFRSKQSEECQEVHYSQSPFHPSEGEISSCQSPAGILLGKITHITVTLATCNSSSAFSQRSASDGVHFLRRAAAFQCLLLISSDSVCVPVELTDECFHLTPAHNEQLSSAVSTYWMLSAFLSQDYFLKKKIIWTDQKLNVCCCHSNNP